MNGFTIFCNKNSLPNQNHLKFERVGSSWVRTWTSSSKLQVWSFYSSGWMIIAFVNTWNFYYV